MPSGDGSVDDTRKKVPIGISIGIQREKDGRIKVAKVDARLMEQLFEEIEDLKRAIEGEGNMGRSAGAVLRQELQACHELFC